MCCVEWHVGTSISEEPAGGYSETSVPIYPAARCHIPEDINLYSRIKSRTDYFMALTSKFVPVLVKHYITKTYGEGGRVPRIHNPGTEWCE
jgi:hypothetical protein